MAKKHNPQHDAVKKAWAEPERRWNFNRHCAWVFADSWSFFTNYKGFSLCVGNVRPEDKFHGVQVPEHVFTMQLDWWPPRFLTWWRQRRLV